MEKQTELLGNDDDLLGAPSNRHKESRSKIVLHGFEWFRRGINEFIHCVLAAAVDDDALTSLSPLRDWPTHICSDQKAKLPQKMPYTR